MLLRQGGIGTVFEVQQHWYSASAWLGRVDSPSANSESIPWDYSPQPIKIDLLAQRFRKQTKPHKQIQPGLGVERAFGQALREIRAGQEISQERLALECGLDRSYI